MHEESPAQQGPAIVKPEAGKSDINLTGVDLEFMRAGYSGDFELISRLIPVVAKEGDINCTDVNRRCVLHFAAAHGLKVQVEELVNAGADINAQDLGGFTALHLATGYERFETVKTLLKYGADANKVTYDSYEKLPVEIAEELWENAKMSERKIFGIPVGDGERIKFRENLVRILEDATEEEEGDDEELDDGTTVVIRKKEKAEADVDDGSAVAKEKTAEEDDGSTVVIRSKEKPAATTDSPSGAIATDLNAGDAAPAVSVPAAKADVQVTIRVRGETVEK